MHKQSISPPPAATKIAGGDLSTRLSRPLRGKRRRRLPGPLHPGAQRCTAAATTAVPGARVHGVSEQRETRREPGLRRRRAQRRRDGLDRWPLPGCREIGAAQGPGSNPAAGKLDGRTRAYWG